MKPTFRLYSATLIFSLSLLGLGCSKPATQAPSTEEKAAPPIELEESRLRLEVVADSFLHSKPYNIPQNAKIFILPHHIVPGKEIAGMLESMPKAKHIILLSPDHFERNRRDFSTTDRDYVFFDRRVKNDANITNSLLNVANLDANSEALTLDHGVTALLPFIHQAYPDATVNPVLINNRLDEFSAKPLVDWLASQMNDPDTVIVASVDMSHYLPAEFAAFHDELTMDVIRSLDAEAIPSLEVGAPGALRVALSTAKSLGLGNVAIHDHTNSLVLLKALVTDESTSHLFVSFSPGEAMKPQVETYLFCQPGIVTLENRLYWGQTKALPPLPNGDDACVGLVSRKGVPIKTFILPLEHYETDWRFIKKEDRAKILSDWKTSGKLESFDKAAKNFYLNK